MKFAYICLPAVLSFTVFAVSAHCALPVDDKKESALAPAPLQSAAAWNELELARLMASFTFDHEHNEKLFNMGISYLKMNRPALAASFFEDLVSRDARDAEAYNLLGIAYMGCGRKQDAISAWKKSLLIDPSQKMPKKFIEEAGG